MWPGPVVGKLEVEVTDPVDYVEKQERGGEKDSGIGIQLPNVDMDPTFPPAPLLALLIAAEEACAVLPVQALVQTVVLVVVPEQGVSHGHHGSRAVHHAESGVSLLRREEERKKEPRVSQFTSNSCSRMQNVLYLQLIHFTHSIEAPANCSCILYFVT